MNTDQLKDLLRRYRLKPNFTYGQNFLLDEIVLTDMADAAALSPGGAVLEIGPGIGNLTRLLLQRAGFVLAVEKDPKFLPILKAIRKDFPKKFYFEIADILEYDFQKFFQEKGFESYSVAANIPYYITGKILKMLMAARFKPQMITLLTQKEVAGNVCAKAGDLSVLAISVQLFAEPKILQIVPARSFYPAPKVDSAVLQIAPYETPRYKLEDEKKFFRLLKACFAGKRKQIHNTLSGNLGLDKNLAQRVLEQTKIAPQARPQELTIEQWIMLAENVERINK